MTKWRTVAILSTFMLVGFAGAAPAQVFTGFYDFADSQYADDFTDVRRGSKIDGGGLDLGGRATPRSTSPARPGPPATRG
jgi:hypothetical protein